MPLKGIHWSWIRSRRTRIRKEHIQWYFSNISKPLQNVSCFQFIRSVNFLWTIFEIFINKIFGKLKRIELYLILVGRLVVRYLWHPTCSVFTTFWYIWYILWSCDTHYPLWSLHDTNTQIECVLLTNFDPVFATSFPKHYFLMPLKLASRKKLAFPQKWRIESFFTPPVFLMPFLKVGAFTCLTLGRSMSSEQPLPSKSSHSTLKIGPGWWWSLAGGFFYFFTRTLTEWGSSLQVENLFACLSVCLFVITSRFQI